MLLPRELKIKAKVTIVGTRFSVAKHFIHSFIDGRKFQINTNHRPLKWLFNNKDPSSKFQGWLLKLEESDYEITYLKGKSNSVADALSRYYPVNSIYPEYTSIRDSNATNHS